ncbi:hypothetical protein V6E34_25705 [Serratia marcescens]|uniref:hypothetical protein n=1 Tax=Serratia marcescens TaxID=615 RepID=UPI002FD93B11
MAIGIISLHIFIRAGKLRNTGADNPDCHTSDNESHCDSHTKKKKKKKKKNIKNPLLFK